MTQYTANRRTFMKGIGATGVVAVAGCLEGTPSETDADPEPSADDGEQGLPAAEPVDVDAIAADPADLPPPVDWDEPRTHEITMETIEVTAEIEPGVTLNYMTYDGQIPGPMIRVREGDTIDLTFEVPDEHNVDMHNVDFHAVYGPGGGAEATTIAPGDEPARLRFQPKYAGVHIYHCAVPNMDQHISLGMFGAILVEPEEGLPEVDREFYFGQHEVYTDGEAGEEGHHTYDFDATADEDPTYVLLNGEAYGFTPDGQHGPVKAEVGETVRVYFANGGPNLTSALHPIGNVWSKYYRDGDLLSEPGQNVETAPVAPGTVVAGDMEMHVPGPVKIVDHALSRVVRKGMLGVIDVEGEENPDIYDEDP
ncbi:copper-containing nitrite reductase [Natronobacterium texcoconense]|uniref:Copper-containing nitrite reductase n=1 Tax=Natronobacterium texcoconense TaxID=1095778 RepID=A0A1H1IYK6_NATTX|nr:copper-containing nitrite reductase [Natronobacterium texcoconense]SDR42368.1 dissimilatory nitrite reductase (NO-forming), copper type apoprotein [Natronobacterium texcoconense]